MTDPQRPPSSSTGRIERLPVILVHGGLYDDRTAEEYWVASGVAAALDRRIIDYRLHRRPERPADWGEESACLAAAIDAEGWDRVAVIGASDGCSAAIRLAIDHPEIVARLVLAWPATAGDPVVDALTRAVIEELGPPGAADALLRGADPAPRTTLRGVTADELAALSMPVVLWPTIPENQAHQGRTTTALAGQLAQPILLAGGPEPSHSAFASFLDGFVAMVVEVSIVDEEDGRGVPE